MQSREKEFAYGMSAKVDNLQIRLKEQDNLLRSDTLPTLQKEIDEN